MSESNDSTPTPDLVRELRDDELETVSGGYVFSDIFVESIIAPRDLNSGHTVGLFQIVTDTKDTMGKY